MADPTRLRGEIGVPTGGVGKDIAVLEINYWIPKTEIISDQPIWLEREWKKFLPDIMEEMEMSMDEQLKDSEMDNVSIIGKILPGTLCYWIIAMGLECLQRTINSNR